MPIAQFNILGIFIVQMEFRKVNGIVEYLKSFILNVK